MKRIVYGFAMALVVIGLSACGGGSASSSDTPDRTSVQDEDTADKVQIKIDDIGISLDDMVVSNGSVSRTLQEDLDLNISKEEQDVVGVFNDQHNPVLLSRKYPGDTSVEISLESSAEVFVLYHPKFNGVESNDPKELSRRIRSHEKFQDLVSQLKHEIESKNPCPLDPVCSPKAKYIAIGIAEDLQVADLYK